ncbi:MAG TPA: ABC transporter substrate-binding protein [Candidatus Binatia bacterium]|jgi:NitT/TauT family transport system substrate-binding protein
MKLHRKYLHPLFFMWRIAFAVSIVLATHPSESTAQSPKTVVIGVSNPKEISAAPMLMARYLGYFKEDGLDVKFVVMSSDISMKGLITGDVDFTSSVSSVVKAAAIAIPVKTVMNFFNGSFFYLLTKPEITRIEQLRNKIVAISRYGSATDLDAKAAFRHFGMEPGKDVNILAVGGGSARIASLVSGRVDGAILNSVEKIAAERAGMRALLLTGQYFKQPVGGLGTSVQQILDHRDTMRRSLRAVARASAVMRADRNKTKSFLLDVLDVKPEYADGIYDDMMKVFLPTGKISLQDLAELYDEARKQSPKAPPVPLSALVDYTVLEEAQAAGTK